MYVCGIGTIPVIQSLQSPQSWTQLWYVDDASAGGSLSDLHKWFLLLCSCGAYFGPNYLNVLLLLHPPDCMRLAKEIFGDSGIQVVTGHWFLSGFIGDSGDRQKLMLQKVLKCGDHLMVLLHHSLRLVLLLFLSLAVWVAFCLRIISHCGTLFADLESSLSSCFFVCIVWCVSVCYWETIVFTSFAVW